MYAKLARLDGHNVVLILIRRSSSVRVFRKPRYEVITIQLRVPLMVFTTWLIDLQRNFGSRRVRRVKSGLSSHSAAEILEPRALLAAVVLADFNGSYDGTYTGSIVAVAGGGQYPGLSIPIF